MCHTAADAADFSEYGTMAPDDENERMLLLSLFDCQEARTSESVFPCGVYFSMLSCWQWARAMSEVTGDDGCLVTLTH